MLREFGKAMDDVSQIFDLIVFAVIFYFTADVYIVKRPESSANWEQYFIIFAIYILFWIFISKVNRVYQSRRFMSTKKEVFQLTKTHIATFLFTFASIAIIIPQLISDRFLIYFEIMVLWANLSFHIVVRRVLQAWRTKGKNTRYALIVGSGPAAYSILDKINKNPQLGYKVIGYIAPEINGLCIPYLGDYSSLTEVLNNKVVDFAVITAQLSDEGVQECLQLLDTMGKTVTILLDDIVQKVSRSRPIDFGGLPMVAYDAHKKKPWQLLCKRLLDVIIAGLGLLISSPFFLVFAITIKLTSKGPVFFVQERVGLNGRKFNMYKFRSMVVNAEELKEKLKHLNEMSGPVFKITNDPRVTSIGKFLRKTSLDELPQLINVLNGDMSLVGPRPPLPSEVNMYDAKHRKRLSVNPGITCIWQISGRNEIDFEQWMEMDERYIDNWTIWKDVGILIKTVPVVLSKKGAS